MKYEECNNLHDCFKQSIKFKDYDWEQLEGVILYGSNYVKDIKEIKQQFTHLIFEAGYGCETSMRLLEVFKHYESDKLFIKYIEEYRSKKVLND